ncbi:2-oxo acid dehydrogenase subunit E2 (plasmid) [Natronosalvus halobius]|nr:2-oxo acid dehydrogenase subunit E2 [Natronosalvus halobius]
MQRQLELPDVGEGIAEGEIVRWLVGPGDQVTEDQPLAEVETDKAIVEVPSPIDGTVEALHAEEGEVVEVGSAIVTFAVDEADASTEDDKLTSTDETIRSDQPNTEADSSSAETDSDNASTAADQTIDNQEAAAPASQVVAPPRVKRLARELGVSIGALPGAADGKPVAEADVRAAGGQESQSMAVSARDPATELAPTPQLDSRSPAPQQPSTAGAGAGEKATTAESVTTPTETANREKTLAAPATRQLARELGVDIHAVPASEKRKGQAFVTPADVETFNDGDGTSQPSSPAGTSATHTGTDAAREERIPYRGIRRTIGNRMEQAKYTAPHVAHHDSVDVSNLASIRRDLADEVDDDVSLTYLPFVMKSVVSALQNHPEMNAVLDEDNEEIVQKHYYNIGVATATEAGLMVPVIRDVDQKGVAQLAREIDDVVHRARSREISPKELQGGTFTITNFGAIGGDYATPIINYPEAAILGLGTIKDRPVVVDDEVLPRATLPLSLSVDHRLIDGAIAASFTNDVKRSLSNPERMLLW